MMKLEYLVEEAKARYTRYIIHEKFREFLAEGKKNHWYVRDYETWAASHIVNALFTPEEMCSWEGVKDSHRITLGKRLLKEFNLI